MIEVKNLVKRYGNKLALDGVSFTVNDGEILGLLGPNGAGKSTTMNIMTGYISSSEGEVYIDGSEIFAEPIKAKSNIGYLPEQPPLYLDMTVKAYLSFMYDLKKVKLNKNQHIEEICEMVGITGVYNRIIKHLSKGYKQRVGLAQALLGNPRLIILDEPTVGLDPKQIIEIRSLIKSLKYEHTVILSSHVLSEIQAVCDRVVVINKGKVVADNTTENLSGDSNKSKQLVCLIEGNKEEISSLLQQMDGVLKVDINEEKEPNVYEYYITVDSDKDIRRNISIEMAKASYPVLEIKQIEVNLEDVFLELTQSEEIEDITNSDSAEIEQTQEQEDNENQEETNELLEDENKKYGGEN